MLQQLIDNSLPSYARTYLEKYLLNGWQVETAEKKKYNNIVVIPAIKEHENIIRLLHSLTENDPIYFKDTLFLFVINNPKNSDVEIKRENQLTIEYLRSIINKNNDDLLSQKIYNSGLSIGIVDASSGGYELPEKDAGVGLARKIGMDLSLTLFDYNNNFKKIIICLDADCTVEKNYLKVIVDSFNKKNLKAACINYQHLLPERVEEKFAIVCYEIFLRYYVVGLKYAKSPYAFQTIGSTMVCDSESYCKAGGMNKRKAAEDFYFLQKLAKITDIHEIKDTTVYPSSRASWRVPFGTGQRINRFLSNLKTYSASSEYLLYDPRCFDILKQWLEIFNSSKIENEEYYIIEAEKIHQRLKEFLLMNSFDISWKKILLNSKNEEQIRKQKQIWFDGFRTMKLIHYLRDTDFPPINMFDAVEQLLIMSGFKNDFAALRPKGMNESVPSLETQLKYLEGLRRF